MATPTIYRSASQRPRALLEELAPQGQPWQFRMYMPGFEDYMGRLPVLDPKTEVGQEAQIAETQAVLTELGNHLRRDFGKLGLPIMPDNEFGRVILAVEEPSTVNGIRKEGAELVLALWGNGFTSPPHGHATGFIYEDVIRGRFRVNEYAQAGDPAARIAHPRKRYVASEGVFAAEFEPEIEGQIERPALIHNFTALDYTVSLHYLPEHTRDGRGNKYEVKHFELGENDATRVAPEVAMQSRVGDAYLVHSANVGDLGDHFIVVTGGLVQKPQGMRPQEYSIPAPEAKDCLLSCYPGEPLVLLKVNDARLPALYDHFDVPRQFQREL